MKTILSLLFLLSISFLLHAQTGWQYLPNAPVSSRIDDIYFVNADTGVSVDAGGDIYKTTDGGNTWSLKFSSGYYLRSVEFLNDSVGFAGSLYNRLYKTIDGGDTWTNITNLLNASVTGICGLNAVGASTIYGVGIWSEPGYVIKSTDAGASWSFQNMSAYAHGLVDCYFFSVDTGFVTGIGLNDEAIVLYTDDGGATWQNKFSGSVNSTYAWKIQFLNRHHGIICIASTNYSSASEMAITNDSGMMWTVHTVTPAYNELEGIGFINEAHGWVGGYLSGMFETVDSGATWNHISFGNTLNRFFQVNDTLMYSSGESVYKFTDTSSTVITAADQPFIPIHALDAVYPNPSSDAITISYTLRNKTMVDLSMFDATGKRVARFVHEQEEKGNYSLSEEIKSLPAGKYFICLNTNEGAVVSDFINVVR